MKIRKPNAQGNDPAKAGQRASKPSTFGPNSRYAVYAVHTRFAAVIWVVADAEVPDEHSLPSIIRQEPTFESAIEGLPRCGGGAAVRSFKPNVFEYLVKVNGRVHGTCRVTVRELNRVATLREAIAKKVCARDEDTIVATCIGEHYWPKVR